MTQGAEIEVWRGGVNTWECDVMGHMNVRFYVVRAIEGLVNLAAALGLEDAFRSTAASTVTVTEQHIRFLREARAGAPLHMTAGVIETGEDEARVLQRLMHSASGDIAACFQTTIAHVTTRDTRRFAWSGRSRALAEALRVTVPTDLAPRSLPETHQASQASLALAEDMGLFRLGVGAIGPQDCDAFGRMRPEIFIGRVSDGVPGLFSAWRDSSAALETERPARVGGAVLEFRLRHHAWPRAGDRFEIRSGLAGVDRHTRRLVHWMLDPATGQPWATAEAVAAAFDLDNRKIIAISDQALERFRARITPGLTL